MSFGSITTKSEKNYQAVGMAMFYLKDALETFLRRHDDVRANVMRVLIGELYAYWGHHIFTGVPDRELSRCLLR